MNSPITHTQAHGDHPSSGQALRTPAMGTIPGNTLANSSYVATFGRPRHEDFDEDEGPEERFSSQHRWIKPEEVAAKIEELRDSAAEEDGTSNMLNPRCGCGYWFFPRANCHHAYPLQAYYCPKAKSEGANKFCPKSQGMPQPNGNFYEAPAHNEWFVVTDEDCGECEESMRQERARQHALRDGHRQLLQRNRSLSSTVHDLEGVLADMQRQQQHAPQQHVPAEQTLSPLILALLVTITSVAISKCLDFIFRI